MKDATPGVAVSVAIGVMVAPPSVDTPMTIAASAGTAALAIPKANVARTIFFILPPLVQSGVHTHTTVSANLQLLVGLPSNPRLAAHKEQHRMESVDHQTSLIFQQLV